MAFYLSGNVVDQNLVPVIGAEIYVYAGGELATGLQDSNGNPLANPLRSVANGFYEAYSTQGGSHVLRIFWGGRLRYVESIGEAVIAGPVRSLTVAGTAYTLARVDAYSSLQFTNNGAITVTVPNDTAVNIPINAGIEIIQLGNGQITPTPASGVTLVTEGTFTKSRAQHAIFGLRKIGVNTWIMGGALA